MTTFYRETLTCQNCGATSEHQRLGSTNQFGSVDLDTRPPEMARSTLHAQIQVCPHCNYCAVDISETSVDVSGCVSSTAYQHQFKGPEYPPLANAYLCNALIQEGIRKFSAAGWGAMKAAWVCDDAKNRVAAKRSRIRAIELIRRAVSAGEDFCEESGVGDAILVDLLRRADQFEEANRQIELGLTKQPEATLRKVFEFQRDLVAKIDFECHTLEEV